MKFLMGMICGLAIAIAVPFAMSVTGTDAHGESHSKKTKASHA